MPPPPSTLLLGLFVAVTAGTSALFLFGIWHFSKDRSLVLRRVLPGALLWATLTALIAKSGFLTDFSTPPKLMFLVTFTLLLTGILAFLRPVRAFMDQVPLWFIIGINFFRLPLELTMHLAANEGIMPPQMSYSGSNLDIITGCLALPTAWLAYTERLPRIGLRLFNIIGATLLINVLTIAIFSMPTPFRRFFNDPPNVWIADFPFVWLPTILVPIALFSHLTLFRFIARARHSAPAGRRRT